MSDKSVDKANEFMEKAFPKAPLSEKEFSEKYTPLAKKVKTMEDFEKLFKEVAEFPHDYGTIVHACAVMMQAAFSLVNETPKGGITGFQASYLGKLLLREFSHIGDGPYKIVSYDNFLFPQYENDYDKTISSHVQQWLIKKAFEKLESHPNANARVADHWYAITQGHVPFGYTVKD